MKRSIVIAIATVLLAASAGSAIAAQGKGGVMIDGTLSLASEPTSGFGTTVGLGVGASMDITDKIKLSDKNAKIQLRGDLSYYDWDNTEFGFDVSYRRIIAFGGGRYFFPMGGRGTVAPYLEAGLELSYDRVEVATFFGKASATEIALGLAGGAGLEIPLADNLVLGFNGRLHLITDSFLTLGASLGVKF
jgi:opacity protein-like surface antigen